MASSPRRSNKPPFWRRLHLSFAETSTIPVGWMCLTGILYAAAGVIIASFPAPYWLWNLALGGALAQSLALAGPQALKRFRWWSANALVLLAIAGTGAIGIALSTALGYAGTDNLDEILPQAALSEVIRWSLISLVIAALGGIICAETGDRLLPSFNRIQTTLILAAVCILGLGLGGLIGLVVVAL